MANGDSFEKAAERDGALIRRLPQRPHPLQMGEIRATRQFDEASDPWPPATPPPGLLHKPRQGPNPP